MALPPRQLLVLCGSAEQTALRAAALTKDLDTVLHAARGRDLGPVLGQAFDAVVVDLHEGLDADLLGAAQGFVWAGGALILRMPAQPPPQPQLAVHPYTPADVGHRFWQRLLRLPSTAAPVAAPLRHTSGTAEQAAVVDRLAAFFLAEAPAVASLTADRGRGKSAALGLALSRLPEDVRVVVTAGRQANAAEVLRFAPPDTRFLPLATLARDPPPLDVLVVDEAARVPVPLLQRLVRQHPVARIAFATTTRGYEGTGRGYVLRFLRWLESEGRPLHHLTLAQPIRFAADDPLERAIFDLLALDATPSSLAGSSLAGSSLATATSRGCSLAGSSLAGSSLATATSRGSSLATATSRGCSLATATSRGCSLATATSWAVLDREALAADEPLLRQVFGLMVHAHYRTTPSDLHRLLDAPNLDVHVLRAGDTVLAASLVAEEGGLPPDLTADLAAGRHRIRGHALADTLITHAGHPDAGPLRMRRSVRIATHPALRRQGLGRQLADAVHAHYAPDLFGTLFGATEELLRWRRAQGYQLVRVGGSRGDRTGEPAAVMVRPVSPAAHALVASLRGQLARNLPIQLQLMAAEGELGLEPALSEALALDLRPPAPFGRDEILSALQGYLHGPRTHHSVAAALRALVDQGGLSSLDGQAARLVQARVLQQLSWSQAARAAQLPTVPAAQRLLRRSARVLAAAVS